MKRLSLISALTAVMIMMSAAMAFAEGNLELVSSYPEDGQTNTSMENLGVKLTFSNPINSEEAKKTDKSKFSIKDENGKAVPINVLFSEKNDGLVLVLADADEGFTAENNAEYTLTIDAGLVDNEGNVMEQAKTVTFKTYNQQVNNMVNMVMMFTMFGGIMVLTMRQNNKKDEDEPQTESKEAAFNPYKEAKKTGKSVEEVRAEQAKKEAKLAKKKARKKKDDSQSTDKKIENCAELLNNVYHVHAPAPVNKADRSIEALKAERKASGSGKSKSGKGKKK
ncbi:MAG: Ig-like domain-containing protein [Mogibacterium sp.]|nr:Ig-like domain-containing protein [Mogibacterium sp.]